MHQPGGRGEYPSTPYYYPPPPPTTTSSASAPPFTDYSSSYSYNYPSYPPPPPPPPPLSDPPPPPTHHQPDTHLHYNNNPPPSYFPPNYDHSPPNYPTPTTPTPYDPHPSSLNYPPPPPPNSAASYVPPYHFNNNNNTPSYVSPYDAAPKYEHSGSAYLDPNLTAAYGTAAAGYDDYNYKHDGVYAYQGKHEPYGARGTATSSKSSSNSQAWSGLFDDYGRPISFPDKVDDKASLKLVRAVPKVDDKPDVQGGVQKFKVKLLPESGSQSTMDVICMVGLDGIRMLDPNTSRTLRIYPLDTVTRCDKIDSSTFAFWSKTSVDIDPRRIRLQSNTYTTNTILDTVTAATVQFKEMGGRIRPSEASKSLEVPSEKKKGLGDWITKLKPVNEEKDHWVPDEAVSKCTGCGSDFGAFNRRHHCRNCGDVFCDKCTQGRTPLTSEENAQPVRVCDRCMAEVTHRLSKAKEAASRPVTFQSHEDLAKKLQEEMEKNLRISSGSKSKSESSGKRMREVACPTCTVHLQVQVPSSGSETIECGVCQQPFIVSAH